MEFLHLLLVDHFRCSLLIITANAEAINAQISEWSEHKRRPKLSTSGNSHAYPPLPAPLAPPCSLRCWRSTNPLQYANSNCAGADSLYPVRSDDGTKVESGVTLKRPVEVVEIKEGCRWSGGPSGRLQKGQRAAQDSRWQHHQRTHRGWLGGLRRWILILIQGNFVLEVAVIAINWSSTWNYRLSWFQKSILKSRDKSFRASNQPASHSRSKQENGPAEPWWRSCRAADSIY